MRDWLKTLRLSKGKTMKQMAEGLKISESYYCGIENGYRQKDMDMTLVAGLASVLEVPVEEIVQKELKNTAEAGGGKEESA